MQLKKYQERSLETLRNFLIETNKVGPSYSFMGITEKPYKKDFFVDAPFICIKIPTGGGKTLVACHAIKEIIDITLKNKMERGIVLWFVPTEAIKSQTLRKLNDRNDAHRKVLDEYFDNGVKIFSNEEALKIRKEDAADNLCIIISSLDAFRKEEKSKYKVYQESGSLMAHFENVQDNKFLEKDEGGTIINSLANVVRLSNPLIVIDEGHRAKTELSIKFLNDLNPSFVIEFTATPRDESNVLVNVKSSELKDEKMVKIPIILESVSQWQQAISRGVLKRDELEKLAKKENKETDEYIRPIALLQAEQEKESPERITVDKIKEFLVKECKIPEEEIAIKTSSRNDLKVADLFSRKCKIKYILTVNALAEGWDCSFAYILISVANIGSKISVEQIIGRIVRLPNAKEKINKELNDSYVFASAKNFNEAASNIISGLVKNGFSKSDVINASEKEKKYEFEVSKRVKEDLSVPILSFDGEELEFADLIGDDFELSKQNPEFEFQTHYDSDGRVKIDIKEGDTWLKERQTFLNIVYSDKNFSEKELSSWLDKKLRFIMLDKNDKTKFLEKAVKHQLKHYKLSELSVNRFVFRDRLEEVIRNILVDYARKQFDKSVKSGNISVKAFEKFPEKIVLSGKAGEKFKKNFYEDIDELNKEEMTFVGRIDSEALPNIKFWVRNREKTDPFYIQGWRPNKFYPDFVAVTNKGNLLALEWKGKDRVGNPDTDYKEEIAKFWEKLGKGKLHFFLVHVDNVEEQLNKIKEL